MRDLGGLPVKRGGVTRFKSLIRSDNIEFLSSTDWQLLSDYGVKTIIDLRFPHEIKKDHVARPLEIKTINISLDSGDDQIFWSKCKMEGLWCTPLYYKDHLHKFSDISALVMKTIANAPEGVLFHCASGRDRTGLITMLLLHLAGVEPDVIAQDHEMSHKNLSVKCRARNEKDDYPLIQNLMLKYNKTTRGEIGEILSSMNVEKNLLDHGLSIKDLEKLKQKL